MSKYVSKFAPLQEAFHGGFCIDGRVHLKPKACLNENNKMDLRILYQRDLLQQQENLAGVLRSWRAHVDSSLWNKKQS